MKILNEVINAWAFIPRVHSKQSQCELNYYYFVFDLLLYTRTIAFNAKLQGLYDSAASTGF